MDSSVTEPFGVSTDPSNMPKVHGGQLRQCKDKWAELTSDQIILNAITGYSIVFEEDNHPPKQTKPCFPYKRNLDETLKIDVEIKNLLKKGVIEESIHEEDEFVSCIFTRPKKNGGLRIILNLSELNKYMEYQHFKMDNLQTVTQLVTKNCCMASIDLKDAYYSVPIHSNSRKYLKFIWQNQLFQFKVLPNGLSSAPRLFTKILKPVFATLRTRGIKVIGYLDDTLVIGNTRSETEVAVYETKALLEELGFTIHPEKSVLEPSHNIKYLGFMVDSSNMSVKLPNDKVQDIKEACSNLIRDDCPTIRRVAQVIGKLIAAMPAMQYGTLHYRILEKEKIQALKSNRGHFDRRMRLTEEAMEELHWWLDNIDRNQKPLVQQKPHLTIQTDASGKGWGATNLLTTCGGKWNETELNTGSQYGINYLELLGAFHALKSFCKSEHDIHVRLQMDNTTAVSYINHMGGTKSHHCNALAKEMWEWSAERNIELSAAHLPGKDNVQADHESRNFNERTEWKLDERVFKKVKRTFGTPEVDLFASRLNHQVPRYVSWKPDPDADRQ